MPSTPKAVRRNGGSCTCPDAYAPDRLDTDTRRGECKGGNCIAVLCLRCKGELCSWGPIWCPCDSPPRWVKHRGMYSPGCHAAVKPSIAKRR